MINLVHSPCISGVSHDQLVQLAEKNFSNLPTTYDLPDLEPCRYTGSLMTVRDDDMPYAHIAMAVEVQYTYIQSTLSLIYLSRTVCRHGTV